MTNSVAPANCPSCHAPLPPRGVLCIACGYHLESQTFLATHIEKERPPSLPPVSANPYASPALDAGDASRTITPDFDLTSDGVRRAEAIVSEADLVWIVVLLSCFCGFAWPLVLPWYAFRLMQWRGLNARFAELRHPNSLSPHGALALRFQAAHSRLVLGIVVGAVLMGMLVLVWGVRLARIQ